jgi:hypothetical protein
MSITKKYIFYFIFIILGFAAVTYFFTLPAMENVRANKIVFEKKQTELQNLYAKVDILEKASKDSSGYNKIISTINNYWPDNQEISTFIIQTEELAKAEGIVLENFSITQITSDQKKADAKTSKTTAKSYVKFSFSTKSTYPVAYDLLKNMEILARFNSINQISLTLDQDNAVNTTLTGEIYYGK